MEFLEFSKTRYSVRKYQETPVEEEKIRKILEAAMVAPTACNNQPQKIYVVRSPEARAKLKEVCPCTFDAPVIFAVGFDTKLAAKGRVREHFNFGDTDAAIVCTHMMLAAQSLGLGSCWVGWFKGADVKAALDIPEGVEIVDLLPVGYPAQDAAPAPLHEKSRSLDEVVEER